MSAFEHSRFEIYNAAQHPYRHTLEDFAYTNPAAQGEISTVQGALDWLFAVLYPQTQPSVATTADLPAVGNTLNDMRVVEDDGDGKAASYRWEQREGDASAKWYKIYDMDWGSDSILESFQTRTQDLYVMRQGYDDLDSDGAVVPGTLAGQTIYGGKSAGSNLTLFANSGDGVGASTGYVQFGDNVRPTQDSAYSLGTSGSRFINTHSDEFNTETMRLGDGSITDATGVISFDDENLETTGLITADSVSATGTASSFATGTKFGAGSGQLTLANGSITSSSGAITFNDENLSTTGTFAATSSTLGSTLVLATGSITDSTGTISFDNENLTTSGIFTAGRVDVDNLRLDGNTLSSTNGNGNLLLVPNGTGIVDVQKAMTTLGITSTGVVTVTGQLNADNIRVDANVISSTNTNGSIDLQPNGSGLVTTSASFLPTTDSTLALGAAANRFSSLYLATAIGDGTNTISMTTLMSLRDILSSVGSGMSIFYDGSKWVASLPDTEVDHGSVSGLGDDDHTQYALLLGRSGGQALIGGTAASNNLDLDSTSNSTKGAIRVKSSVTAFTDAAYSGGWAGVNLGGASNRFVNVYSAGEFIGLRLENLSSAPSSSSQRTGRLFFNTTAAKVYVDTGSAIEKVGSNRYETDTSWDGVITSLAVTVSGIDATKAIWQLKDNTNNYQVMHIKITSTSTTNVTLTANGPLPSGSYRLIGIE